MRELREPIWLIRTENSREITKEAYGPFLFEYQRAVLLALKDEGILNEAQYRRAERRLEQSL